MNNHMKLIIMVITLSLILIVSSSYAILTSTKVGKNNYSISIGDLKVIFKKEQTEALNLTNMYPMTDEEGMAQEDVLSFTIENAGTVGSYYDISIEETSTNPEFKSVIKYISNRDDEGYTEPKVLSDNKYIELTGYIESGATRTYKVKAWLAEEADNTYMGKEFKAKVVVNGNQNNYAIDAIKKQLVKYSVSSKDDFQGGLVAVNTDGELYNETDETEEIREYRFSGPIVNNYIRLKDDKEKKEDWRIIGIFKDELGQEYLRVVRDSVLPDSYLPTTYTKNNINIDGSIKNVLYTIKSSESSYAYWNKNDSGTELNRWEESGLQYFLNTEQDDNSVRGYLSYLSNDVKSLLLQEKMYLGTIHMNDNPKATPKESYFQERDVENCKDGKGLEENTSHTVVEQSSGCQVWKGNAATWTGAVSLMYPSDYGLSSIEKNWTIPFFNDTIWTNDNGFEDENIKTSTWMYNTMKDSKIISSWLLNPSSNEPSIYASYWITSGDVHGHYPAHREDHGVRPVLNLKSDIKILGGTGEVSSPYELQYGG